MIDPNLSKERTYEFDLRHVAPMVRDFVELATLRLLDPAKRRFAIGLGRHTRQQAFDARDDLPPLEIKDLPSFLGSTAPQPIVLPPLEYISLAGLGFATPYVILATVAAALQPKRIFETGTFRGVSALTLALNAPKAEIYTLDLPSDFSAQDVETLTRGDQEWTRLVRDSVGVAFHNHPSAARIHQIRENSLTFDARTNVGSADFCFIDGGHSYECVHADTVNAFAILAPDGVVLWDDYTWFMDGVRKYIKELRRDYDLHRIVGTQYVIYKQGR